MDKTIIVAIISAATSVLTIFIVTLFKNPLESKLHSLKLEIDNEYEQRKKTKDVLSKYKMQFINSAEYLNHRMWNLRKNHGQKWHNTEINTDIELYYYKSSIYRLCRLFSWIKIIEQELVFIDTTFATQKDLDFIKFIKTIPQQLQDTDLLEGKIYDVSKATDHIYRDSIDEMTEAFIVKENSNVISFSTFKKLYNDDADFKKKIMPVAKFIDGINPTEERFRWDLFYCLHYTVIAFLNEFGYDFQQTDLIKIKNLINDTQTKPISICDAYIKFLKRNKLHDNKFILAIINELPKQSIC